MTDSTTRRPRRRWLLPLIVVGVLAVGLLAVAGAIFFPRLLAAPSQPLPYQHSKHVACPASSASIAIPAATSGKTAGLPSLYKCMGCHASAGAQRPQRSSRHRQAAQAMGVEAARAVGQDLRAARFCPFQSSTASRGQVLPAKAVTAMSPRRITPLRITSTWVSA